MTEFTEYEILTDVNNDGFYSVQQRVRALRPEFASPSLREDTTERPYLVRDPRTGALAAFRLVPVPQQYMPKRVSGREFVGRAA